MGLIRLAILAVIIWLCWRMVKNFKANQTASKNSNKKASNASIEQSTMVLCQYCSVHVPEQDAVKHNDLWFCSNKHKAKFLTDEKK